MTGGCSGFPLMKRALPSSLPPSLPPSLSSQDGILRQMGNPKKIDWEALPALWTEELPAQGGGEGEEVPVKAVQAFSLDEDF